MKLTMACCAAAFAIGSAEVACGNGADGPPASALDNQANAPTPRMTLTVQTKEDFPGSYGNAGSYEKLSGTLRGEVNPKDPRNAIIQDLELAPTNARGMVEYTTEFVMLKPKDMTRANGVLRYDAPNRGNILTMVDPAAMPGDGIYLERGYVLLYAAWQGDVPKSSPSRLTLTVPVAKNADGSSITGPYVAELIPTTAAPTMSLPGGVFNGTMIPYAPASLDTTLPGYALTRRINESDARLAIAASDWRFANCDGDHPFPGTPDGSKVCIKGGFVPGYLYEIVYQAKEPKVMGLGLAALRDTVSFFRHQTADAAGTPNPVSGRIQHTIGQGTSQSGNAMKTFLHLGFNTALDGGRVFDGIYAHVAARQTNINTRFATPGSGGGLRTDHHAFGQTAPRGLAADYQDNVAERSGGVMRRCNATQTCPKFFLGLSGTEFWQLQGSPVLTDAKGLVDLKQPDNARIYYYASTQHGGRSAQITYDPAATIYPVGSMVDDADTSRALFIALEDWVVRGVLPPDSQVPSIADGTLVRPDQVKFPVIQGLTWQAASGPIPIPAFQYLARYNDFSVLDFGPLYRPQDESGIPSILPPIDLGRAYAILVPQVDPQTGLAKAGIHSVDVDAPLGTSLEFNYPAAPGIVDLVNLSGSYLPFFKTEAERKTAGDSRPSLESLYGNQAGYVAKVKSAAAALVAKRFLLQADADRRVAHAQTNPVL